MKRMIQFIARSMNFKLRYIISFLVPTAILIFFMTQLYTSSINAVQTQVDASNMTILENATNEISGKLSDMVIFTDFWYTNKRFHQILNPDYNDYITQFSDYLEIRNSIDALISYYNDLLIRIYPVKEILLSSEFDIFFPIEEISEEYFYNEFKIKASNIYWANNRLVNTPSGVTEEAISVFKPIYDLNRTDNTMIAVVEVSIPKSLLFESFINENINNSFAIVADDGEWIVELDEHIDIAAYIGDIKINNSGIINSDGVKIYYEKLKTNNWHIVEISKNENYLDSIKKLSQRYLSIGITIFLVLLFLIYVLVKTFNQRVANIIFVLSETEKENFDKKVSITYNDELSVVERHLNLFIEHIQNLMKEIAKSHKAEKEAEMDALQAQINPHFLYNTLDSINWLAIDRDNYEISEITTRLGDYLRLSLSGGENLVLVSQEIEHCQLYVDIQQIRTSNSLKVTFEIDDEILDYKIIKFLLQPFMENAIIHGFLEENLTEGIIKVTGFKKNNEIIFGIEDNGVGFDMEKYDFNTQTQIDKKSHYGIFNIKQRLLLQYGSSAYIKINSKPDKGTKVEITIPTEY